MMLESYSTAGINITQGVSCGGCPSGFTRLLCLEKNWRNMQSIKAKSNEAFISWIIVRNKRAIFYEIWI